MRGTKIFRSKVGSKDEMELMDSAGVADLDGALLQQPEMSRDGKFIAITLRGSKRETGIWDIKKKTWTKTGLGCQINWTPDGSSIYWVNPTGNGGSEVFHMPIKNGKPPKDMSRRRAEASWTCRAAARTSTFRSCPSTASGWSGASRSAGTTTTSPTTRSTCGRWGPRPRRRRA